MYICNMKRIRLSLTGIGEVLKESAEKRLEQENSIPKCDDGRTREFYEELGVPENKMPQSLLEREKNVELKDDDFEEVYSSVSLYDDDILFKVSDENGTTLFIKEGYSISVLEHVDEIDDFIEYMNRNWLEKIIDYFLFLFRRKNKLEQQEIEFKIE